MEVTVLMGYLFKKKMKFYGWTSLVPSFAAEGTRGTREKVVGIYLLFKKKKKKSCESEFWEIFALQLCQSNENVRLFKMSMNFEVVRRTRLSNGMILSTLSISSHGFALGFPKGLMPMELVFLTYKPMIIP